MKTQLKLSIAASIVTASILSSHANAKLLDFYFEGNGWTGPQIVYHHYKSDSPLTHTSNNGYGSYRIPGIVTLSNGTLMTVADKRFDGTSGNTDIVANGNTIHKVWFSYKISHDGGITWSEERFLRPKGEDKKWQSYIGDPQIVHNPDSGSTFVFGYQSDTHIAADGGNFDMVMFRSDDGGKTWSGERSVKEFLKLDTWGSNAQLNKVLQGPGAGMYYKGKLYVPIQIWGNAKDGKYKSTSGMLVSSDNGKTWTQSSWVSKYEESIKLSESNVFHHKGEVYLAAKIEAQSAPGARKVWKTSDDGKTWTPVQEDFLPDNMVAIESSSFALTENTYFVGYSTENGGRGDTWITTNTGRRIKVYDKKAFGNLNTMGYTSITADADNIYILFEGSDSAKVNTDFVGAIMLRRFDYAGKEYANLNGRLQRSGSQLLSLADRFSSAKQSYLKGGYGADENAEVSGVLVNGKYKVGLFYESATDVADDVSRTYGYDETVASALVGIDGVFAQSGMFTDTLFAGYQYTRTEFENSAKEESHAAVAGYSLDLHTDLLDYGLTGTYRHASNKIERNSQEGLGKEAEYSTDVISVDNRVSKTFAVDQSGLCNVRPFAGFEYMNFKHEAYAEKNGNGFNDITVDSSSNNSYGPYLGAELFGETTLASGTKISYSLSGRYKREMADVEDWADSYTVFDDRFVFSTPVDKDDFDNIFEGRAEIMFELNKHASLGAKATASSIGDSRLLFQCEYRF